MNTVQTTKLGRTFIATVCLLGIFSGCASLTEPSSAKKGKKKESWSWFKKKEYQEPKSLVAIWTEDTFAQPGKPMTRGFGGRLYFYNEKSQAIPVDGELIVYGYEEDLRSHRTVLGQQKLNLQPPRKNLVLRRSSSRSIFPRASWEPRIVFGSLGT